MGSGKSTVGRLVAQDLEFQFVDTDSLIEEKAGISIAEIFATEGEEAFRQLEGEMILELVIRQAVAQFAAEEREFSRVVHAVAQETVDEHLRLPEEFLR